MKGIPFFPKNRRVLKTAGAAGLLGLTGLAGKSAYDAVFDPHKADRLQRQEELLKYLTLDGGPVMNALKGVLEAGENMDFDLVSGAASAIPPTMGTPQRYRPPSLSGILRDEDVMRLQGLRIKMNRTLDQLLADQGIY